LLIKRRKSWQISYGVPLGLAMLLVLIPFDVLKIGFKNFGVRPFSMDMGNAPEIRVDLSENDTAYSVRAEIPGAKKDDIKVQVDGNRVSISAKPRK